MSNPLILNCQIIFNCGEYLKIKYIMVEFLMTLIVAAFLGILSLNVYFRVKVFKVYKRLVKNRVEFKIEHFLSPKRLEEEILPKYPKHRKDILTFISHIRFSMTCASVLIVLITALAAVLMFIKE